MKNLISVEIKPQQIDANFNNVMDKAYKQKKLAESAPELLNLLIEARRHIDVSFIRTTKKAESKWSDLALKLDAAISKLSIVD